MSEQRKKLRLGELLVQQGLITKDQLAIVLAEQRNSNVPIGRLLVRLGFVTETAIRDIMARTVGQESIDLAQVIADPEALSLVPEEFARRNHLLPIAFDPTENVLTIATTEIFNVVALDQLRAMLGPLAVLKTQLAAEAQLGDYIDQFYGHELSVDGILTEIETGEIDYDSLQAGGDEYTQPMVRLVNAILVDAVKRGASDIHFEPEYAFLRIRYRIDGVLETVRSLHKTYMPGITVRLKVVSEMNIAETRAPQDGRLSLTLNGRPVDFRVSTQPTIYGENVVLRVLDREKSIVNLDRMNLSKETMGKLDVMLARPEGILVVTGPTGSGKTTTLYSLLAQVNDETVNIMTLEDPVEYPLTLMRQTSVNDVARQRHPFDHAPGSGHHPGRRGARQGNRGNGVSRRNDRSPGIHHAAYQLGTRRIPPSARHRHPARNHGRQHHRHHRPATGADALYALQGSLCAFAGRTRIARTRR